jgi:enamidase
MAGETKAASAMRVGIVNLATIVSGSWREPIVDGDCIISANGLIEHVGGAEQSMLDACDVVIDAGGATAVPGLIDSQVHVTFGDFTPRQNTVGYLTSYLHGGTTTSISASEVHVPGRPSDPQGVKALAVAAHKCFLDYRPGGMKVHAGSIILEPGLVAQDFVDIHEDGVWLAKAGFGGVKSASEYIELVAMARDAGLLTTLHTGGASIPGSFPVTGQDLIDIDPTVSFHINGGPVAIEDKYFEIVARDTNIAMQVCTAGNLRTTLLCAEEARRHDAFDRFLIATDTPTGSGIMPLGMIYTMIQIASLTDFDPTWMISASTGNVADIYGLNSGYLKAGRDADIVIIDAPLGCTRDTALAAMKNGDPCAIGAVITDGVPRFVGRSRNTPPTTRRIVVERCSLPMDFTP